MKYLLITLISLSGCGKQMVPDKVEVEHTINVQTIEPYIRAYCMDEYPNNPELVEPCIRLTVGQLLNKI